jgi:CHASE3 domain sensor protein
MKEAVEARKHTSNIIISAATLLSELKDAETGERGFLLMLQKNMRYSMP